MKHIVRSFVFATFSLWLTSQLYPGMTIDHTLTTMLMTGLILSLLLLVVKPILSILFIPINIMTFGLLSWAVNVIVIYILTIIQPSLVIHAWTFPGYTINGFVIPQMELSFLLSLIATTLIFTAVMNFLTSLTDD